METEKKILNELFIRKVANGWMVDVSGWNDLMAGISRSKDAIYVFRDLDSLFAWIRDNT